MLLAIVLAGNCLSGWCQSNNPSSTGGAPEDTVKVPISYIKVANAKMLQGKLYKDIIVQQDSIISLHKYKYQVLNSETELLQKKLDNTNQLNANLKSSLERNKKKTKWIAGGAVVSIVGFVVLLISK